MPKNGTPPKKGNSRGKKALGRAGFEKGTCCSGDGCGEAGGESQGESCALGQACDGTGWLQGLGMLRSALSPCRDSDVSKAKAASTQLVRARNIPVVAQSPRTRAGGCSITPPGHHSCQPTAPDCTPGPARCEMQSGEWSQLPLLNYPSPQHTSPQHPLSRTLAVSTHSTQSYLHLVPRAEPSPSITQQHENHRRCKDGIKTLLQLNAQQINGFKCNRNSEQTKQPRSAFLVSHKASKQHLTLGGRGSGH